MGRKGRRRTSKILNGSSKSLNKRKIRGRKRKITKRAGSARHLAGSLRRALQLPRATDTSLTETEISAGQVLVMVNASLNRIGKTMLNKEHGDKLVSKLKDNYTADELSKFSRNLFSGDFDETPTEDKIFGTIESYMSA